MGRHDGQQRTRDQAPSHPRCPARWWWSARAEEADRFGLGTGPSDLHAWAVEDGSGRGRQATRGRAGNSWPPRSRSRSAGRRPAGSRPYPGRAPSLGDAARAPRPSGRPGAACRSDARAGTGCRTRGGGTTSGRDHAGAGIRRGSTGHRFRRADCGRTGDPPNRKSRAPPSPGRPSRDRSRPHGWSRRVLPARVPP